MYDEDRQTALAMYERMFDETADEQGLLKLLVSPTRQAVVLARSYDAKERKQQIESRSMDDNYMPDPEDVPSFVFAIDKTAQQAAELAAVNSIVDENQASLFEEFYELPELEADAAEIKDEPVEDAEAEPAEEEELSDVDQTAKAVDAFLADFSIENGELVPNKAEAPVEEVPAEPVEEMPLPVETEEAEAPAPAEYKTKTNIFLLILYIFLSIPLGLIGISLLLIPTVLFLALAITLASVGAAVIGMCFGSFAVIADMLVVFGGGLVLLALGLLFVWLFIWFLGGVIFGFIRGICKLGRKLCCKEVAVQ